MPKPSKDAIDKLVRALMQDTGKQMSTRGGYRFLPTSSKMGAHETEQLAKKVPNALEPEKRELLPYGMGWPSLVDIEGNRHKKLAPNTTDLDVWLNSYFRDILSSGSTIDRALQRRKPIFQPLFSGRLTQAEPIKSSGHYLRDALEYPERLDLENFAKYLGILRQQPMIDRGDYQIHAALPKMLNDFVRANIE